MIKNLNDINLLYMLNEHHNC